ncbi:MAG: ribosome biogenesis GTPase [Saprospiraceae bacterium]|jgi:ribosome biogenesis GTPase|tara:strand:- start:180 stop:1130 length:951 start_codon:yes stop_codon:yes gene_type:complete
METGTVIKSTGSWYEVRLENGDIIPCRIQGKFRLGTLKLTNPISVGDSVQVNIEREEETVGTIREINDRKNYVLRQSPRKKHFVHIIAANIDQAVCIVSLHQPKIKVGFIDRFLLMTEPYEIPVTIVFNKSDLNKEEDQEYITYLRTVYENIGYQTLLTSNETGEGIEALKDILKGKLSLIAGQSGVGKSTLVNSLAPDLDLRTQEISDYSGKGQHTTTFAEIFELPSGGQIIDTPGIKTLGFNYLEKMDVAHNFREFFVLSKNCKFGDCMHINEPECAVKNAIDEGKVAPMRYENYLAVLQEIEDQNYWEIQKDL